MAHQARVLPAGPASSRLASAGLRPPEIGQASRAERRNRSISAGSRWMRGVEAGSRFVSSSARGSVSGSQAPVADQRLVDAAEPAAVRRVDRHAERRRLAVHRPARRDDEVGERDQALRVDGALGEDHRRQRERGLCSAPCSAVRGMTTVCVSSRPDRGFRAAPGRADLRGGGRARCRAVCGDDEHSGRVDADRSSSDGSGEKSAR